MPDVDEEVLVLFEGGDPRRPYVVGSLWNGVDAPPESMDGGGANYLKVLHSRNGVTITLDDHDGQEKLVLATPGGQRVVLEDGPARSPSRTPAAAVELAADGIRISTGKTMTIEASSLTVTAAPSPSTPGCRASRARSTPRRRSSRPRWSARAHTRRREHLVRGRR